MPPKKTAAPPGLELYTALMSYIEGVEIKGATMPYTSHEGNMFSFLKEGSVGLRLPDKERIEFINKFATELFKTNGTVMKEYVTITKEMLARPKTLQPFVMLSNDYVKTLKKKPSAKK